MSPHGAGNRQNPCDQTNSSERKGNQKVTLRALLIAKRFIIGPRREKPCHRGFANNKGAGQPAHRRSLISAFVIRLLESIISMLATSEISIVY